MKTAKIFLGMTIISGLLGLGAVYECIDAIMHYRSAWLVFVNIAEAIVFLVVCIENAKRIRSPR